MRGDLTVFKSDVVRGLVDAEKFIVEGTTIMGADNKGVAKRETGSTFRVSMNSNSVKAIGGDVPGMEIPVRFRMTTARGIGGHRVYVIVSSCDNRSPHGVVRTRK